MIPLDIAEALKSGVYTCATTGHGKSDLSMYVASLLMKHGVIVIVFDPTQDWQKRSTIPNVIRYNQTMPTRIPISKVSVIYDLSHKLTILKQQRIVEQYSKTIMDQQADIPEEQRKYYFLIFEEAHTYFPQGCMTATRYQYTARMMSQGRNYRVRVMCITQFSSMIDKKAMRYMRQRYFGATDEPNDVEYLQRFFPKKDRDNIAATLTSLKAGQFIYKHGKHTEIIYNDMFTTTKTPQPIELPQNPEYYTKSDEELNQQTLNRHKKNHSLNNSLISLIIALLWFIVIAWAILSKP